MSTPDAGEDCLQSGGIVLLEEEGGDTFLAAAADRIAPNTLERLSSLGGGMVVLVVEEAIAERLELPVPGDSRGARAELPFTAPIDAARGVTGGWSSRDRAVTMRVAAAPDSRPHDIVIPGHVHPVRLRAGDLLARPRAPEASLELARRAELPQALAVCRVVSGVTGGGSASRRHRELAGIARVSVAHLRVEIEVEAAELVTGCRLPTSSGEFTAAAMAPGAGGLLIALSHGDHGTAPTTLVHVHRACTLGDAFGSVLCGCRRHFESAVRAITTNGSGLLIYVTPAGMTPFACGRGRSVDVVALAALLRRLRVEVVHLPADAEFAPRLRELGLTIAPAPRVEPPSHGHCLAGA